MNNRSYIREGYYPEINIARGITLLFVMLGHSFPDVGTGITNPLANWICHAIYSFHMGAFFFFSGFVSASKLTGKFSLLYEIKKKLWRLGVPYLLYSFVALMIKVFLPAFASESYEVSDFWKITIGISPNGTMWFLWTLLVISILYLIVSTLLRNRSGKEWVFLTIGVIMHILYYVLPPFWLTDVLKFSLFYALGILINCDYKKIAERIDRSKGYLVLAIALFIMVNLLDKVPYILTCGLATVSILTISRTVERHNSVIKSFLYEMGNYSYDLYLISYFVQRPLRYVVYSRLQLSYLLVVILMFTGGIVVTYAVCRFVIRKNRKLEYLLLGKTWF